MNYQTNTEYPPKTMETLVQIIRENIMCDMPCKYVKEIEQEQDQII